MRKIIAVVDLGHFKVFSFLKNPNESARLDLLDSYDIPDTHGKAMEKVTDAEGSFNRGEGKGGTATGSGEPHNVDLEIEKKVIKRIASDIGVIVEKEGCSKWHLAAGEAINNQILENLDPTVRTKLHKNIRVNLTNAPKSEILGRFED
ncbi:MAG: host attachment protein [Nitrospirae bacterium]|nr:host attachment protein [Nitrospirota bacterium]